MPSGNDARFCLVKETTFNTRVAPTRFFTLVSDGITFQRQQIPSRSLGGGRWNKPVANGPRGGGGSLTGEVPTTGFGIILDALHNNSVTPVQQASTTAYLQTHTLDTPPTKTYSLQKQVPPVTSSTLVPFDYTGVMFTGITFNWSGAGLLDWEIPVIVGDELTGQTLVTYVAPTSWAPFAYQGGSVTIAGVAESNVLGDGTLAIGASMRDDAYALGTGGTIAKPVETDRPTASMTFTADFEDLTNVTRVTAGTIADVVVKFEGATIEGAHKFTLQVTLPDCRFTSPSPNVSSPGPVQQSITLNAASTTNDAPVILYKSTDTAL